MSVCTSRHFKMVLSLVKTSVVLKISTGRVQPPCDCMITAKDQ